MEENTYYTGKKLYISKKNGSFNHYEYRKYNDATRRNSDSRIANQSGEMFGNESKHVEYGTNATPEFLGKIMLWKYIIRLEHNIERKVRKHYI